MEHTARPATRSGAAFGRRSLLGLLFAALVVVATGAGGATAQEPLRGPVDPDSPHIGCSMKGRHLHLDADALRRGAPLPPSDRLDRPIDAIHYDLTLDVTDTTWVLVSASTNTYRMEVNLSGELEARIVPLAATDVIRLDFDSDNTAGAGMSVLEATADGIAHGFTHAADTLAVDLGRTVAAGDTTVIRVRFEGEPNRGSSVGYGLRASWFRMPDYEDNGIDETRPIIGTLSQPVSARTWWPCHDHPYDAATVRTTVVMYDTWTLAAPGHLERDEIVAPGRRAMTYSMPTPIPSYLVSIAAGLFDTWNEMVDLTELRPDGSEVPVTIPIDYFAPDTLRPQAENSWANTAEILQKFEEWFGPYPYADIKYGNALFSFGGAMEHPTVSSMGDATVGFGESRTYPGPVFEPINAHEIAHQWFGNCVRLERWGDIWLNEGVARYCEVLWLEEKYGEAAGRAWLDRVRLERYGGTLRNPDPADMFGGTTYNKGGWTMHMLRQVLGREGLLRAMRNYVTDPALRHGAVTVEDFQRHCEEEFGDSMDWFFGPWQNREGRPSLSVSWEYTGDAARVRVTQPADRVYRLPLPIRLVYADGSEEDFVRWVGDGESTTVVEIESARRVAQMLVDPQSNWLLDVDRPGAPRVTLASVAPNPFNPSTAATVVVEERSPVTLDVFDVRGRFVARLAGGVYDPGVYTIPWDGTDADGRRVASGVYALRLVGPDREENRKVTLIK